MARVLVIDDSEYLAREIKVFLEGNQHAVVAIGRDGNEGVELYKEHSPDIALLDITMPNKDGRDCLAEILEFDEQARVVVVSAVKNADIIVECLQNGARSFIEKPLRFRDESFCDAFREAVACAIED